MIGQLQVVLDVPGPGPAVAAADAFWTAALGWPLGPAWPDRPELATFTPTVGTGYVHRQVVSAGPLGAHLDLQVGDLDAEGRRLAGLGARAVGRASGWRTFASPGGFAFCLVASEHAAASPDARPEPVTDPAGRRRRLVQVCLDVPGHLVGTELAFWRAALGWREVEVPEPEFLLRLVPQTGAPLQVLLQRLGENDTGGQTRAHLDLGCDDVAAEAARMVGLGAVRLHDGSGFVALRDPAGGVFCVTANSPDAP